MCSLILINLIVGAVLDSMGTSNSEVLLPVRKADIEHFSSIWAELDPHATGAAAAYASML